jgi:hypothetical protein
VKVLIGVPSMSTTMSWGSVNAETPPPAEPRPNLT